MSHFERRASILDVRAAERKRGRWPARARCLLSKKDMRWPSFLAVVAVLLDDGPHVASTLVGAIVGGIVSFSIVYFWS